MSATDDLLAANATWAEAFDGSELEARPARGVAVIACMDARIDVAAALGLSPGDAHVIRNAGGVVTDDVIRSLAISQRKLGTAEVVIVQHTDCGLMTFTDEEFASALEAETGVAPPWSAGTFADLEESVRASIARVVESPFVPRRGSVRGFVFDVASGELREVV